jgi:hypothetical protein
MMTMHASKGLEFPYVFIVGCEDGVLPHQVSLDEGNLQEERRLLYVGITRAKIQLWMSYSKLTRKFGEHVRLKPSRFFDEIRPRRSSAMALIRWPMRRARRSGRVRVGGDRGVVRLIGERRSPRGWRVRNAVAGRVGPGARPIPAQPPAPEGIRSQKQQPGLRQNRGFGWRSTCATDRE